MCFFHQNRPTHQRTWQGTLWKPFSKSMKAKYTFLFFAWNFSCNWLKMNVASVVPCQLHIINLYCTSDLLLNNSFQHLHDMFQKLEISMGPSTQYITFSAVKIDEIALLPILWYFSIFDNGINRVSNCFHTTSYCHFTNNL